MTRQGKTQPAPSKRRCARWRRTRTSHSNVSRSRLIEIADLELPSRPTKKSDSRAKGFGDISVELDAIPPDWLRLIVSEAIEQHLPPAQFEILKAAEASEQRLIKGLVGMLNTQEGGR